METALQTRGLLSLPPNPRTRALYPSNGLKQRLFAVEPKTLPGFALSSNGFKKYPSFVLKPNGVLPKERNLHICRAAGQPLFREESNTPKFLGIEVSTLKKYVPLGFSFSLSVSLFSKGCLSMSTIQRPIRRSIICMARRYGSNTRKRKIKSRRRGGDLEKKKKRKRKSTRRKKDKFKIIKLVSAAGTGYVYAKKKGKNMKYKLEIKKYDPEVKHHVLFKETK